MDVVKIREDHLTLMGGGINLCQNCVLPQGMQRWHEGFPCSPPSPCRISCGTPSSLHHTCMESSNRTT